MNRDNGLVSAPEVGGVIHLQMPDEPPPCPRCLSADQIDEQPPVPATRFRWFHCRKCGHVWSLRLSK